MQRGWPGLASAFYASDVLTDRQIDALMSYVGGKRSPGFPADGKATNPGSGAPRQPDTAVRIAVENAAMREIRLHYEKLCYDVEDVSERNLGWDLEAALGMRKILIEMKGGPALAPSNSRQTNMMLLRRRIIKCGSALQLFMMRFLQVRG